MEFGCIGAPFEVKFAEDDKAPPGAFEGYGAVFGNIDSQGDVIGPGAFAKSLLERERAGRGLPPMYKMHGIKTGNRHEPIGVWEAMGQTLERNIAVVDTTAAFAPGRDRLVTGRQLVGDRRGLEHLAHSVIGAAGVAACSRRRAMSDSAASSEEHLMSNDRAVSTGCG